MSASIPAKGERPTHTTKMIAQTIGSMERTTVKMVRMIK